MDLTLFYTSFQILYSFILFFVYLLCEKTKLMFQFSKTSDVLFTIIWNYLSDFQML